MHVMWWITCTASIAAIIAITDCDQGERSIDNPTEPKKLTNVITL